MSACCVCPKILICVWSSIALVSVLSVASAHSSVAITFPVVAIAIVGVVDLVFECIDCLN